jgi:hypothetical protein
MKRFSIETFHTHECSSSPEVEQRLSRPSAEGRQTQDVRSVEPAVESATGSVFLCEDRVRPRPRVRQPRAPLPSTS